ncbi:potassium-transporting ATPase subunit C [Actinospica sp. MGRD01-02]|uniref:Potassium-transporting ATPase KdpC subunit n=1 Tax=Actinospica acidithermotolerans TaxID=2828514 RepID=A0A941EDX8_9ACTN|nr:potassium-transporting ATPase subunit C [Actinospica acidithermotolerans]MBR7826024.1 potassium-transporting ATPase subunit C [Actinospica acidithermotolerans]
MSRLPGAVLRHLAAIRAMLVFTVITGIAYPLVMTGIGQAAFHNQADGSLITNGSGQAIASKLLCQTYVNPSSAEAALNKKDGVTGYADPIDKYFQSRPTYSTDPALGRYTIQLANGCTYTATGSNNLGPNNDNLTELITLMRANMAAFDSTDTTTVTAAQVATDAVTESGSDVEPYITPLNADQQAARIAQTRGITLTQVKALIQANTTGRDIGILGEPGVNTTTLNIALDKQYPSNNTSTTAFQTGATS